MPLNSLSSNVNRGPLAASAAAEAADAAPVLSPVPSPLSPASATPPSTSLCPDGGDEQRTIKCDGRMTTSGLTPDAAKCSGKGSEIVT
eukprot:CAMPEP_0115276410 /NCGR_PEP_ID=MMETSP0270-20121206/56701_1 /TAXON_ID=71861 /ORGANISM="Scrippsiella trochoidea, Strain CCMP3099" /LENGTH=87 /DNA_ID=CAMNT_0002693001 /DNA_START=300 /DNA_END=559 /DNA_ORIENTATION=-